MYGYADKFFERQPAANEQEFHGEEPALHHTVDCVILGFHFTELHVLLHRFPYKPFKGHWALLGGFIDAGVSLDEAALQTVQRLTGLDAIYMEQVYTFGSVERVPTERVITTCYYALIRVEPTMGKLSALYQATWHPFSQVANLKVVYDHSVMLRKAIEQLRHRVRYQPIGFELLPEKFTMTELRKLYESILGRELDKRNFNKKIRTMNLLRKLDEKQRDTSKRGAFLYQFDAERYQQYVNKGFLFDI